MTQTLSISRRRVWPRRRRRRLHHRPPARAGRGADATQREAEHRRHRHRRPRRLGPRAGPQREHRRPVRRRLGLRRPHLRASIRRPTKYKDYREMLDKEPGIDAVVVGTPDHMHAVGLDGGHQAGQARLLREAADPHGLRGAGAGQGRPRAQGRHADGQPGHGLRRQPADQRVDRGRGDRRRCARCTSGPTGPRTAASCRCTGPRASSGRKDEPPVPATLDWDLWLGPAPWRPYHPAYAPFRWRGWWDFGSGGLGDMGIHNIAPVFPALKLGRPDQRLRQLDGRVPRNAAAGLAAFTTSSRPAATCRRSSCTGTTAACFPPRPEELEDGRELNREDGILFVGDRGKMLVEGWGGNSPRLIPEQRMHEYKRPPKTLPRSIGHHQEWLEPARKARPPRRASHFAGPLTEAVLLGTVCVRVGGQQLVWDSRQTSGHELPRSQRAAALRIPPRLGPLRTRSLPAPGGLSHGRPLRPLAGVDQRESQFGLAHVAELSRPATRSSTRRVSSRQTSPSSSWASPRNWPAWRPRSPASADSC